MPTAGLVGPDYLAQRAGSGHRVTRIIGYVAKSIIAWADWDMDAQQALSPPHLVNRFGTYDVEVDTAAEGYADALIEIGFEVTPHDLTSGLHVIEIGETLSGGTDHRREGIALGE